jgi:hypothetical protein
VSEIDESDRLLRWRNLGTCLGQAPQRNQTGEIAYTTYCCLQRAADRCDPSEMTLDGAKDQKSGQAQRDGNRQRARNAVQNNIGRKRKKAAGDIGAADRQRAFEFAACLRPFQAKLETHHEFDPAFRIACNRIRHDHVVLTANLCGDFFRQFDSSSVASLRFCRCPYALLEAIREDFGLLVQGGEWGRANGKRRLSALLRR